MSDVGAFLDDQLLEGSRKSSVFPFPPVFLQDLSSHVSWGCRVECVLLELHPERISVEQGTDALVSKKTLSRPLCSEALGVLGPCCHPASACVLTTRDSAWQAT